MSYNILTWGDNVEFLQSKNPSDEYRYYLLKKILQSFNRSEDFSNIISLTTKPIAITKLAPPMKYQNIKVAIIGAGPAGLACAYELRKLGCEIHIYEANPKRIGGRVNTYYFAKSLYGELGAMRVPVSHEVTWHYINLFKLNTIPFVYETINDILYVAGVRIRGINNDEKIMRYLYPKFDLNTWEKNTSLSNINDYVFNYFLLQIDTNTRKELLMIQKEYSSIINYFDEQNFYQIIKLLGISDGGFDLLTSTMGIIRGAIYNSYLEILRDLYTANTSYLYQIENGMMNLPYAFYNSLKSNKSLGKVVFFIGNRINGIYYNPTNNKVILKDKNHNYLDYDYVVCAIPFSQLRLMEIKPAFSSRKMQAIRQVNYENAQKTLFLCNERFWEKTSNGQKIIGGSSVTDLSITEIYYPSIKNESSYGVLLASYNLNLDANRIGNISDDIRLDIIKRQLEMVHGLPKYYLDNVIVDSYTINWNRNEYTLGAFSWYATGQNRLFAYASYLPEYNNKVFFAGEHISSFHAWIQGALQTGMVAANNIAYTIKNCII